LEVTLMQADRVFAGVDVSKATLLCARYGATGTTRVRNDRAAIEQWLRTLPADAVVAMESTGQYHFELARLVHHSGRRVFVLNARDVHDYARAMGARCKSDRVDAQLIARYVAEHHRRLHAWTPGSEAQQMVQALVRRRACVSEHRGAVRQLLSGFNELQPAVRQLQRQFDVLLAQIDRLIDQQVGREQQLTQTRTLLRTITGFGSQGSALLAALFCRVPFANADAVVAYSGLDPRANDSGSKRGRRCLSKRGNARLRRQLYLAAFAASRSRALKATYQAIKARGFAPTEALVILARKLLRIAWAVCKSGKPFDPSRFAAPTTCTQI
jgi:transposase